MSSGGQIIGAVAGGIVGFVAAGPTGALKGATYGAAIGGALDPPPGPDIKGPRIDDNAEQTSSYGAPIASMNGTIGVKGHVIWVEGGKKRIVTRKEDNEGGKGGDAGTTEVSEAFATLAVVLTAHQVDGIGRLWIGPNLVSNGLSDDLATAAASGEAFPTLHLHTDSGLLKANLNSNPASGTVRLYPGFDDQPVDPRMSADLGASNCPAYRGHTVLYLYDWPLENYGNSIAGLQVKAELINSGTDADATLLNRIVVDVPFTGSTSTPVCTHLTTDKAVVYSQSSTLANPREYKRTEYSMSGAITSTGITEVDGNGVIHGWWDEDGPPQPVDSFYSSISLHESSGRLINKADFEYVLFWPSNKIYKKTELGVVSGITPSVATVAAAVDLNGYLYVLHTDKSITKYDEDLAVVANKSFTLSGLSTTTRTVEATWDDLTNLMYITSREGPDGIAEIVYAVDFANATEGAEIALSSYEDEPGISTHQDAVITVVGGVLTRFVSYSDSGVAKMAIDWWRLPTVEAGGQLLSTVTRERMEQSELIESADIDVTLLTDTVNGFSTSGITSIRSALSPLMSAFSFDVVESGYQLKCVPRGQSSVMTIDYNDLDARPFGSASGVAIDQQREMDSQLAKQELLDFVDAGKNYNKNQASSIERLSSRAVNIDSYELPLVFDPDEAAKIVQTLHDRHWLERDDFNFNLPQTYNRLEAADVVELSTSYADYEFRLTAINELADGRIECSAKLNDSAIYVQVAEGGTRILGDTTIPYPGASVMHLLDIPLIRDQDDKPGFAGAMSGRSTGWPGGSILRSVDSGQTWTSLQGFTGHVTSGVCRDTLPTHDGYTIDRTNTLTVDLYNANLTLSSISEEQMLTGKYWFAYGVGGRWELCQYANATLNADGSYTLDTLVRGAKGTEQYTGDHEAGDFFIFLADADTAFIAANISDLSVERLYRGVTSSKSIDSVSDTAFTYTGVNLEPLSPVQLAGTIDGSNNWDLTWLRRSRLSSAWWVTGVDAQVGEDSESYEIDIMNGSTVVRTLTSTSEAVEYSSADQVTDFGSNQTTLTFRVYQMSATVGRGYVAEITL